MTPRAVRPARARKCAVLLLEARRAVPLTRYAGTECIPLATFLASPQTTVTASLDYGDLDMQKAARRRIGAGVSAAVAGVKQFARGSGTAMSVPAGTRRTLTRRPLAPLAVVTVAALLFAVLLLLVRLRWAPLESAD